MLTSVTLAYMSSETSKSSVMSGVTVSQPAEEVAVPIAKEDMAMEPAAEETTQEKVAE